MRLLTRVYGILLYYHLKRGTAQCSKFNIRCKNTVVVNGSYESQNTCTTNISNMVHGHYIFNTKILSFYNMQISDLWYKE